MKTETAIWPGTIVGIAFAVCTVFSVGCISQRIEEVIEIPGDLLPSEQAALARTFVSKSLHDEMRAHARATFRSLSPDDTQELYVRWREIRNSAGEVETVQLIVGASGALSDAEPVVEECRDFILTRIPSRRGVGE